MRMCEVGAAVLRVYDDLNVQDATIVGALKQLLNPGDEGGVRRPYGVSRIPRTAVLLLLNVDGFHALRERVALARMSDWMARNCVVYPLANTWDIDAPAAPRSASSSGQRTVPEWYAIAARGRRCRASDVLPMRVSPTQT